MNVRVENRLWVSVELGGDDIRTLAALLYRVDENGDLAGCTTPECELARRLWNALSQAAGLE